MSYVRPEFVCHRKSFMSLIFFATIVTGTANMVANTKSSDLPAKVVAHLVLLEAPGSEMLLQTVENKQYLYVQKASKHGFMVVDVTKPTVPSLLNDTSSSSDVTAGKLDMVSPEVGLAEVPDKNSKGASRSADAPTETVNVLDLSDPAHPKVIQKFTGVTSTIHDQRRGLIYLANSDGLWILRHTRPGITPAKTKRPCGSEDAIAAMPPDCQ